MTTTVTNRTVTKERLDTSVVSDVTLDGDKKINIGFESASTKTSGFMKTVNMFLRILLTLKGSDPHNPRRGTELPDIYTSSINDEEALYGSVNQDVDDATRQIIDLQSLSDADENEKLAGARISFFNFDQTDGSLAYGIELYNVAGANANIEIPSIVLT